MPFKYGILFDITVWVSEEAAGRDMPVIAQIDEEHLEKLQQ